MLILPIPDLIVLIETRPQLQAGFQKLAQLGSLLNVCETHRYQGLHVVCHQFAVMRMDVVIQAGP